MQPEMNRSISFRTLKWDEVDEYAKHTVFKDRSSFVEYCVEKEIHHKKLGDLKIVELLLLFGMALTVLLLLLLYIKG